MNRNLFRIICIALFVLPCLPLAAEEPPNIILILADDLGYGDVQAYNNESTISTPHLDSLAEDGMRFTDAHTSSSVCSPTRYSIHTGRYFFRTQLKHGTVRGYPRPVMHPERQTLGSLLQNNGYQTGFVGKWHLGAGWPLKDEVDRELLTSPEEYLMVGEVKGKHIDFSKPLTIGPNDYGFDYTFIKNGSLNAPPYVFFKNGKARNVPTKQQKKQPRPLRARPGPRSEGFDFRNVLKQITEESKGFITRQQERDDPFFLYFSLTAPHIPIAPARTFQGATDLGPYGDFVKEIDSRVGELLKTMRDQGINENTLVIFTSDNGSYMGRAKEKEQHHLIEPSSTQYRPEDHESNYKFRGTKGDGYEGGIRVPFMVRWPGKIEPGSVSSETISVADVIATVSDVVDGELTDAGGDSFSFLPILLGNEESFDRPPVVQSSARGIHSIRDGKWKLILGNGSGGRDQPIGKPYKRPYRLYNLKNDVGETNNLINEHPEIAERLEDRYWEIHSSGRTSSKP